MVADILGNRFVNAAGTNTSLGISTDEWNSTTKYTDDGYVLEFAIPLSLLDTLDGPGFAAATFASVLKFNFAVNDNDDPVRIFQNTHAILWGVTDNNTKIISPFMTEENGWLAELQFEVEKPARSSTTSSPAVNTVTASHAATNPPATTTQASLRSTTTTSHRKLGTSTTSHATTGPPITSSKASTITTTSSINLELAITTTTSTSTLTALPTTSAGVRTSTAGTNPSENKIATTLATSTMPPQATTAPVDISTTAAVSSTIPQDTTTAATTTLHRPSSTLVSTLSGSMSAIGGTCGCLNGGICLILTGITYCDCSQVARSGPACELALSEEPGSGSVFPATLVAGVVSSMVVLLILLVLLLLRRGRRFYSSAAGVHDSTDSSSNMFNNPLYTGPNTSGHDYLTPSETVSCDHSYLMPVIEGPTYTEVNKPKRDGDIHTYLIPSPAVDNPDGSAYEAAYSACDDPANIRNDTYAVPAENGGYVEYSEMGATKPVYHFGMAGVDSVVDCNYDVAGPNLFSNPDRHDLGPVYDLGTSDLHEPAYNYTTGTPGPVYAWATNHNLDTPVYDLAVDVPI